MESVGKRTVESPMERVIKRYKDGVMQRILDRVIESAEYSVWRVLRSIL